MARLNINNIENVEGKYHLMFFEGKKMVESAKSDLRYALLALLFFSGLVLLFIVISGFNLFYVGFIGVFLVIFVIMLVYLLRTRKKGIKQCIYAVKNSNASDIVAKQVDNREKSRVFVKSISNTIDKYDAQEKFPTLKQKVKRKRKHEHLVGIINDFEKEENKRNSKN